MVQGNAFDIFDSNEYQAESKPKTRESNLESPMTQEPFETYQGNGVCVCVCDAGIFKIPDSSCVFTQVDFLIRLWTIAKLQYINHYQHCGLSIAFGHYWPCQSIPLPSFIIEYNIPMPLLAIV